MAVSSNVARAKSRNVVSEGTGANYPLRQARKRRAPGGARLQVFGTSWGSGGRSHRLPLDHVHDRYQDDAAHLQFIAENRDNWKNVRVFDSVVEGA